MMEAMTHFNLDAFTHLFSADEVVGPYSRPSVSQSYVLECADGLWIALHMSSPPKFWEGLATAMERHDIFEDPRFATDAPALRPCQIIGQRTQQLATASREDHVVQALQTLGRQACGGGEGFAPSGGRWRRRRHDRRRRCGLRRQRHRRRRRGWRWRRRLRDRSRGRSGWRLGDARESGLQARVGQTLSIAVIVSQHGGRIAPTPRGPPVAQSMPARPAVAPAWRRAPATTPSQPRRTALPPGTARR